MKEFFKMKNRLRELRNRKKLSQKAFAIAFNDYLKENRHNDEKDDSISYATISRWENGQDIPPAYVKDLAEYFDVTIQYFQGLTYSKDQILKIINQNFIDRYDDYNQKGFFDDPFIDDSLFLPIKNYLNYHWIEIKFSKEELKKFDSTVKKFWNETFNFIFDDPSIKYMIDYGGGKPLLISRLSKVIEKQYLKDSQSIISRVFDTTVQPQLNDFEWSKDEMLRYGKKDDIKKSIDELIDSLSDFKNNLHALPANSFKNDLHCSFDELMKKFSDDDLPF